MPTSFTAQTTLGTAWILSHIRNFHVSGVCVLGMRTLALERLRWTPSSTHEATLLGSLTRPSNTVWNLRRDFFPYVTSTVVKGTQDSFCSLVSSWNDQDPPRIILKNWHYLAQDGEVGSRFSTAAMTTYRGSKNIKEITNNTITMPLGTQTLALYAVSLFNLCPCPQHLFDLWYERYFLHQRLFPMHHHQCSVWYCLYQMCHDLHRGNQASPAMAHRFRKHLRAAPIVMGS